MVFCTQAFALISLHYEHYVYEHDLINGCYIPRLYFVVMCTIRHVLVHCFVVSVFSAVILFIAVIL